MQQSPSGWNPSTGTVSWNRATGFDKTTDIWMFVASCFYHDVWWRRKANEPPGDCGFADTQEQFVNIIIFGKKNHYSHTLLK